MGSMSWQTSRKSGKNRVGTSAPDLPLCAMAVPPEESTEVFLLKATSVDCLHPLQVTALKGRQVLTADLTEFGPVGCSSRGGEGSSSTHRILQQDGGCMVVLSKLGETEEAVGFSGKSKSSVCHLDFHLEMVGMEYTVCDGAVPE